MANTLLLLLLCDFFRHVIHLLSYGRTQPAVILSAFVFNAQVKEYFGGYPDEYSEIIEENFAIYYESELTLE